MDQSSRKKFHHYSNTKLKVMQKADAAFLLTERIRQKEIECNVERALLKDQFKLSMESLKPANLIKNTLTSPDLKNKVVDGVIGMATGYISKKIIVRSSHNLLLKLAGAILQIGITSVVAKNPETIKLIGGTILKKIFHKKDADPEKV